MESSIILNRFIVAISFATSIALSETTSNLPILHIKTSNSDINSPSKVLVGLNVSNIAIPHSIWDTDNHYNGFAKIKLHGTSSSWCAKKSYAIELVQSDGENEEFPLLGMPSESEWILVASYYDNSFLRNATAYSLYTHTGHYSPRTRFIELTIDNSYEGLYLLVERITRDKNRLNIDKLNSDNLTGIDLSGSYIIRIDNVEENNGWFSNLDSNIFFQYYYPKVEKIQPEQANYIQSTIKTAETTLLNNTSDYKSVIDEASFIDFALIQELMRNVDGYRRSTYLHKRKNDTNLYAGPIWDFDLSSGNTGYYNGGDPEGWVYLDDAENLRADWWARIIKDPTFNANLARRWQLLRQGYWNDSRIETLVDSLSYVIKDATTRNFERWPKLPIMQSEWPGIRTDCSWQSDVDSLKSWLRLRIAWMDKQLMPPPLPESVLFNPSNQNDKFPAISLNRRKCHFSWQHSVRSFKVFNLYGTEVYGNSNRPYFSFTLQPGFYIAIWYDHDLISHQATFYVSE